MTSSLRWQVWVDWAGDGIWGADGVDVSGDALGLRWQWGRRGRPRPEFAGPASLELTLRNPDHRYTPGNVGGPLGDNVQPGREIRLRAARRYDDFATSGAGSQDLNGRVAADGGVRWEVLATAGNGFSVLDGAARGMAGSFPPSDAVALLDAGDPLATLMVRYRRISNGQGGFVLRCAARNDCLRLRCTDSATVLERVAGGRATTLASGAPLDAGEWHELEIEQTGGGVRVYATNLETAGPDGREILAVNAIANAPESGRHGLWHSFRNTADRWGAFAVGRSLFRGRISGIAPDFDPPGSAAGVCRIEASDVMQRLEETRLYRALPGGPLRSGDVAEAILGWAGLKSGDYALDDGRILLTGGPRSVWDVSAARALRRLQREEHGLIYVDGLGRVRLEDATARAGIYAHDYPATLARTTLATTAGADVPYASALRWDDGSAAVEESVAFRYRRLADEGLQRVWSLNEPLAIAAGQDRVVLAASDAWEAIDGVKTPAAGADYTATDDAAGTGADVTGDITVTLLSEAASGIFGRGRMLRVHNGGTATAYVRALRLWASHCWRAEGTTSYRTGGSGPAGDATLVSCRYADHYAAARGGAEARLAERSRRRPRLETTLELAAAANGRAVVEGRVSDVVAVAAAAAPAGANGQDVAGPWLLEGMEVSVGASGAGAARWWLTGV